MSRTEELSGWGRYPRRPGPAATPRSMEEIGDLVGHGGRVARGNGRAYGDSAIGAAGTIHMRRLNRMLAFDSETGQLIAEAGVLLGDIIESFLPRGWFPFVTPGTKFVTLGGAIAADVHGKNHHGEGSFGTFVDWVEVMGPDGAVTRASRTDNRELFEWTLGGMGLTGVISRAAIRLRSVDSGWIRQETVVAPDLVSAMAAFEAADAATYSVAWIDCLASGRALGRSLVMLGEHATRDDLPAAARDRPFETPSRRTWRMPVEMPGIALNSAMIRTFNTLYWRKGLRGPRETLVSWDSYFYPLDAILDWNRVYGRHGLLQFQCVLPLDRAEVGLAALLRETAATRQGSFLAVLKRMGRQDSRFSFPMEGYTLALDFPANARSLALLDQLDAIVLAHGGRFYLAKDARLSAEVLHRADPRAAALRDMRRDTGLDRSFASAQSERLLL